ncbi:hypothetical protein OCH239_10020 [Roseivivax halodurans JCM 10272]|uniref:Lipoprotein n=1 Tax=Roseivivax halodurans JCM 10272 TaxID=1449350 RepID=X7EEH5_9RHOB|nr:hypothetical protein [Roseivivax halodurans]ETX13518.1 hypothetical protein OCH239_10020 [Roseivivax halodurans JCM 10272]
MRLTLAGLLLILAACEKYTEATSPCFGADGAPVVGRSAIALLTFAAEEYSRKDCVFEPIEPGR